MIIDLIIYIQNIERFIKYVGIQWLVQEIRFFVHLVQLFLEEYLMPCFGIVNNSVSDHENIQVLTLNFEILKRKEKNIERFWHVYDMHVWEEWTLVVVVLVEYDRYALSLFESAYIPCVYSTFVTFFSTKVYYRFQHQNSSFR